MGPMAWTVLSRPCPPKAPKSFWEPCAAKMAPTTTRTTSRPRSTAGRSCGVVLSLLMSELQSPGKVVPTADRSGVREPVLFIRGPDLHPEPFEVEVFPLVGLAGGPLVEADA